MGGHICPPFLRLSPLLASFHLHPPPMGKGVKAASVRRAREVQRFRPLALCTRPYRTEQATRWSKGAPMVSFGIRPDGRTHDARTHSCNIKAQRSSPSLLLFLALSGRATSHPSTLSQSSFLHPWGQLTSGLTMEQQEQLKYSLSHPSVE